MARHMRNIGVGTNKARDYYRQIGTQGHPRHNPPAHIEVKALRLRVAALKAENDGLRAAILSLEQLEEAPLVGEMLRQV